MHFTFTEEQLLLRDSLTRFLSERHDFGARQRSLAAHNGFDSGLWSAFASELAILGATLPETAGGFDGGPVETMLIMEALGGALVVEPYLETVVIGGAILAAAGGRLAGDLLAGIVAGDVRLGLAANEIAAGYALAEVATTARPDGNGWVLDGAKPVVWNAPSATHLLVSARIGGKVHEPGGISVFIVPIGTAGLVIHPYRLIDDRPAADIELRGVRIGAEALVCPEGAALPLLERAVDGAVAALCADAVGGMRRMLDATVAYTKQRHQFGQPLAGFQVLQHRMVDMHIALEQSISATYLAVLNLDADDATRRRTVSAAKFAIARHARMIGQNAVQLHGAMGMTDELAVGHYFKRATVIEHAFGSADQHLARYGEAMRA